MSGYGGGGWYCWPVFELENGFAPVLDRIRASAGRYESGSPSPAFRAEDSCDFIKQIYESMIPKELRHALGEYYTPDWLAEWVIPVSYQHLTLPTSFRVSASVVDQLGRPGYGRAQHI